jgi:dethiobiotin synthetase
VTPGPGPRLDEHRPDRLAVVTGTDTAVGKTWWAVALARALRDRGVAVAARKPAQSYAPGEEPTDADRLAAATGAAPDDVCPPHRWYEVAMAPPMAADGLGRPPFTIADLCCELVWPDGTGLGIVEGAGGPRSPLADDGDTVDLAAALGPDAIVLVAHPGLGTINAVRLAAPPLRAIAPVTVVLNRYDGTDELHRRNRAWLTGRAGLAVVDSVDALVARII